MNKDLRIKELEAEVERLRAKLATYGRPVKHHVEEGEEVGRFLAVKDLGRGKAVFLCFCGKEFTNKIFLARRGLIISCGCSRLPKSERKPKGPARFIHTVAPLEVIKNLRAVRQTSKGKAIFTCKCGKEFETFISKVRSGSVGSCGCSRRGKKKEVEPNNDPLEILMFHTLW